MSDDASLKKEYVSTVNMTVFNKQKDIFLTRKKDNYFEKFWKQQIET